MGSPLVSLVDDHVTSKHVPSKIPDLIGEGTRITPILTFSLKGEGGTIGVFKYKIFGMYSFYGSLKKEGVVSLFCNILTLIYKFLFYV